MEMKDKLEKEINELTNKLREEKPAVYEHLMEAPETIPNEQDEDSFLTALEKYKGQLLELLNKDKI